MANFIEVTPLGAAHASLINLDKVTSVTDAGYIAGYTQHAGKAAFYVQNELGLW